MKKLILFLLPFLFFVSCNSTKVESYSYDDEPYEADDASEVTEAPEKTDDFIGDFEPIRMSEIMVLTKSRDDVKPKQISKVYLVPRTNCVELDFRHSADEIIISLNKAERDKLLGACNTFLEQYESKTVPHQKVTSKTAYYKSSCTLYYGVLSPEIQCSKNEYFVNCEFIKKRPYLLIKFIPSRCDEKDQFTPKVSLYMSPSQVRDFIEAMDQEYLNSYLDDLIEKAYTY